MSKPFSVEACDFSGWATRNDLKCSDGRVIRRDAFKHNDGIKVPLVWNHQHNSPRDVLGHAWLENREEGVYTYGFFNETTDGEIAKVLIKHGDICALSIYANQLQQAGSDVLHGSICEVSLVHKGANPGAFIDSMLKHGELSDDEAIIYTGMPLCLSHSAEEKSDEQKDDKETVADVIATMSEKQQNAMYYMVTQALDGEPKMEDEHDPENKSETNKEENNTMKHNVFDNDQQNQNNILSHADQKSILDLARSSSVGSLQDAIGIYAEQNPESSLAHGINGIDTLFPEYQDVRPGAPELLTTDQGWVNEVLKKVHKSPISRIRTRQADIRNIDNLRAKGYKKGAQKGYVGNFDLIHRTTDPQTVYVKSKLDRDDIIDIQDFDVVQYLYSIDRMNLNEELATAIMIGDGREVGADGKIAEDKIRPIWLDDELYTIHADVDIAGMKATLRALIPLPISVRTTSMRKPLSSLCFMLARSTRVLVLLTSIVLLTSLMLCYLPVT